MVTSSREHEDRSHSHAPHAEGPRCDVPQNPWAPLVENVRELVDYAAYYLSVQADQVRLRIRRLVLAVLLGTMAVISGLSVIITAVVILLAGIGQGLAQLFGGRIWLGNLVTGLGVLSLTVLALVVISRRIVRVSRTKTVEKYAELRQHQRRQHGHDVGNRASAN